MSIKPTSHRREDNRAKILEHRCSAARAPRKPNRALPEERTLSSQGWNVKGDASGSSGSCDAEEEDAAADDEDGIVDDGIDVDGVVDDEGSANKASFRYKSILRHNIYVLGNFE